MNPSNLFITLVSLLVTAQSIISPEFIHIEDCGGTASSGTEISAKIHGITVGSKNVLHATKNAAKIVAIETDGSTYTKEDFCRMDETGNTKEYFDVKTTKIKSVLYKVANDYKLLIVGTSLQSDITKYTIQAATSNGKFVIVESIKCLTGTGFDALKQKLANVTPKPYIEESTRLCFVNSLMSEPIEVSITISGNTYTFTLSPYPKQQCPTCSEIQKPKTCP